MREPVSPDEYLSLLPQFTTDNPEINQAWNLAVSDLLSNICLFRDGLLRQKKPVILAGSGYDTPWTRDAAINTWNAAGLLLPSVAKNTLLSVLTETDGKKRIGGQYWDAMIWTVGAYSYFLYTGDMEFYPLMKECTENSLQYFENTEWDSEMGLFRGPACYGDGIAAYPDRYVTGESGILSFSSRFPEKCVKTGVGIPIFTLSTNCIYAECYRLAHLMTGNEAYRMKQERLIARINELFWNEQNGSYDYALDSRGRETCQEALGLSFAILFHIADAEKTNKILNSCYRSPNGIPCLYPCYERYLPYGIGRHCGTIWPFAQAFFADAAARIQPARFSFELDTLTRNALRSGQFAEIYHPSTGEPYGGVQEKDGHGITGWTSVAHQTWSATGYLRMLLLDLTGLCFEEDGLHIHPVKIPAVSRIDIKGLHYRKALLHITIDPSGRDQTAWIPSDAEGSMEIHLRRMGK